MRRRILLGIGIALAMAAGTNCRGDELIKVDGTKIIGRVVAEDAKTLTMESNFEGLVIRRRVFRKEIKTLSREVREGPGYCVLPLMGTVGVEITAESLNTAIDMARRDGVKIVILRINSTGGSVPEMAEIMHEIARASKDIHFVAYIDQAFSAAAIIAMMCPEIYMAPQGQIGAAVPFKFAANGTPENIAQKFFAAITSEMRAAAQFGKHPTCFVKGMTEIEIELVLRKMEVVEVDAGKEIAGDEVVKAAGKIMSLTSSEAERFGLSAGTLASVMDARDKLGVKMWFHAGVGAEQYLANSARARRAMVEAGPAELQGDTVADCVEQEKEIEGRIAKMTMQLSVNQHAVQAEFDKAMLVQHKASELQHYKDLATAEGNRKLAELQGEYDSKVAELRVDLRVLRAKEDVLRGMRGK